MSDPLTNALVALTGAANQAINTLTVPPEERLIIIAEGKQFNSGDDARPWQCPQWFKLAGSERAKVILGYVQGKAYTVGDFHKNIKKLPAIPLIDRPDGTFEYLNADQGVRFIIKKVQDKLAFRDALLTPGAHVMYDGHARYGRGPCFGTGGESPGEMWEEGTGNGRGKQPPLTHPNRDGIFRLGSKYIAVEAEEITHHGYTANLLEAIDRPKAAECDKDLQPHLLALKGRTLQEIDPALFTSVRDPDPNKKWWSYWGYVDGKRVLFVVHKAGWEQTLSDPDDIGALTPTCRVFAHLGCSTYKHNYAVVRKQKKWVREGNERYAYWTTNLSDFGAAHYWLQHVLTYKKFNAFKPWAESLKHAVQMSNSMLTNDGDRCNII